MLKLLLLTFLGFILSMKGTVAAEMKLDPAEWQLYLAQYVKADGRVVDAENGGISTTQGQGYAMILATAFDDRASFDKLWHWTLGHLKRGDNHLFSWKWMPDKSRLSESVPDANNASDGDLLIAWALVRASQKWHGETYRKWALSIEADLRGKLIRKVNGFTVLMPGISGFDGDRKLVVNPSYWVFPAIDAMGALSGEPVWKQLNADGLKLIDSAAFGRWDLPPDWLALKPKRAVAEGFAPWFGYSAIRIPLYIVWGNKDTARLDRYILFWDMFAGLPFTPGWTDLTNDGIDSHDAPPGFKAIMVLARAQAAGKPVNMSDFPALTRGQPFYSASLLLLAKLAAVEKL